jgi:hypothetical protein
MKIKSEIFTEYFWQTFDRQIDFKEYLAVVRIGVQKKERKRLKGYSNE